MPAIAIDGPTYDGMPVPPKANCSEATAAAYAIYLEWRFFETIAKQLPAWTATPGMNERSLAHRSALAARWAIDFHEYYGKVGYMVGKKRMVNVNIAISGWTRRNIDDDKHLRKINGTGTRNNNAALDTGSGIRRNPTIPTADDARRLGRIVG